MRTVGNTEEILDLVLTFKTVIIVPQFYVQCGNLFKYYQNDSIT